MLFDILAFISPAATVNCDFNVVGFVDGHSWSESEISGECQLGCKYLRDLLRSKGWTWFSETISTISSYVSTIHPFRTAWEIQLLARNSS